MEFECSDCGDKVQDEVEPCPVCEACSICCNCTTAEYHAQIRAFKKELREADIHYPTP